MGLFSFLKRKPTREREDLRPVFDHPVLGKMRLDSDVDWLAENVVLESIGQTPMDVSLQGDATGPDPDSLETLDWILQNMGSVREILQGELYGIYEAYRDAGRTDAHLEGPSDLWGTETCIQLGVTGKMNFDMTCVFSWQEKRDDHQVSVYVEDGVCTSSSVDC
jgi:hypothetical protein